MSDSVSTMYSTLVENLIDVGDAELTEKFRALELERRRLDAEMAAIVQEGQRRSLHGLDGHRTMKHWVRAQINCPAGEATRLRRLGNAANTVEGLGDALIEGHIGSAQAHELARLRAHPRVGDQLASMAAVLLAHAEQLSYEEFRIVARRWETLADLDGAERNDELSHERRTALVADLDGALHLRASGGSGIVTAEMINIFDRFRDAEFRKDVAARTAAVGPDAPASSLPRTDGQRRFDAMAAIFRAAAVAPADGIAPVPVVNLLVGLDSFERLIARQVTGDDPGAADDIDLRFERMESDTGTAVSPHDVLAAAVLGHVRRVVVDGAGVVVDAGRKRRLFTGVAREMALLLTQECDHLGCTVPARLCQVDHLAEWERDDGGTDQSNAKPRCDTHNPWKTANRLRSKRDASGHVIDFRNDGTPMVPVGRRLEFDDDPVDDLIDDLIDDVIDDVIDDEAAAIAEFERRTIRVPYCRLTDPTSSFRLVFPT